MSRKFDYLGDVKVFLAVVEHGSFTAGAVALSTTPSVLSRAVTRLEARLGRQLLQRTTRRVGLHDGGRIYLEQVRTAFDLLDDAQRDVQVNEMGWNADGIERQLAHADANKVCEAYMHAAQYLAERTRMMQAWADYFDALRDNTNVLPFRARAG